MLMNSSDINKTISFSCQNVRRYALGAALASLSVGRGGQPYANH